MEVSFIPEGDLYRLIARSKLPQLKKPPEEHNASGGTLICEKC